MYKPEHIKTGTLCMEGKRTLSSFIKKHFYHLILGDSAVEKGCK